MGWDPVEEPKPVRNRPTVPFWIERAILMSFSLGLNGALLIGALGEKLLANGFGWVDFGFMVGIIVGYVLLIRPAVFRYKTLAISVRKGERTLSLEDLEGNVRDSATIGALLGGITGLYLFTPTYPITGPLAGVLAGAGLCGGIVWSAIRSTRDTVPVKA